MNTEIFLYLNNVGSGTLIKVYGTFHKSLANLKPKLFRGGKANAGHEASNEDHEQSHHGPREESKVHPGPVTEEITSQRSAGLSVNRLGSRRSELHRSPGSIFHKARVI